MVKIVYVSPELCCHPTPIIILHALKQFTTLSVNNEGEWRYAVEFPSCRVIFTALAFFGFLNIYCLRVNLSVALVAMVKTKPEYVNVSENATDNCGNPIEAKPNATYVSESSCTHG